MITINKIWIFNIIAIVSFLSISCNKIVSIDAPVNETSTETVFSSDALAAGALSGMYAYLAQSSTQTLNLTLYSSLQADDLLYLYSNQGLTEMNYNTYTVLSTTQTQVFNDWYALVYRANAIIEGLAKYTGTSAAVKKEYTAEAQFIRAYSYFNLVNTFGSVPLVLETDATKTAYLPNETIANIYTQIIADLSTAKDSLNTDYSATSGSRVGVNKYVAEALLARVYLYNNDYKNAELYSTDVINSGLYSLVAANNIGTGVFNSSSNEAIWMLSPYISSTNKYTAEGTAFIPYSLSISYVYYKFRDSFLSIFETGDLRRTAWINDIVLGGVTYSLPYKYKFRDNTTATTASYSENTLLMRLSEQYLIRAEARARQGSELTEAIADLNIVHTRAGLNKMSISDNSQLIDSIALENRRELFCEQAFRWYNLKRTSAADSVLTNLKSTYTTKSQLLPIPQTAINANPNLTQNIGY